MSICENCKTEYIEKQSVCNVCSFPIQGINQEKVKFRAKQITLKSDVKYSLKRVGYARVILFIIGGFYSLIAYYFYDALKVVPVFLYINISLVAFFIGCAFLSFKAPKLAITAPFVLIVTYYTLMVLIDWSYIFQGGVLGFIIKVFILTSLGYACFSTWHAYAVLRQNPYIAVQMGFKEVNKIEDNLLDDKKEDHFL